MFDEKIKLIKMMLNTQNFILESITEYQSLVDEYMHKFSDQEKANKFVLSKK